MAHKGKTFLACCSCFLASVATWAYAGLPPIQGSGGSSVPSVPLSLTNTGNNTTDTLAVSKIPGVEQASGSPLHVTVGTNCDDPAILITGSGTSTCVVAADTGQTLSFAGDRNTGAHLDLSSTGLKWQSNGKSFFSRGDGTLLAQNATSGFFYLPRCATGAPTGTPGALTGAAACVVGGDGHLYVEFATGTLSIADTSSTAIYGDGSDGAGVADGITALAGATLSGSTYTLTRDEWFTNLTVSTGVTIDCYTNEYRVFVNGTLTLNGTAHISCDGKNAVADAAGATVGQGSAYALGGSNAGAAGGTGAGGAVTATVGVQSVSTTAGKGGAGGSGNGGGNAGSAGGSYGNGFGPIGGSFHVLPNAISWCTDYAPSSANITRWAPGTGGGAGGGDGTNKGGGGGGGGGNLGVYCKTLVDNASASITANGGNGGNAAAGNCGGGGGGGGGHGVVVTNSASHLCTFTATGGALGTKTGTGVNGSAGADGSAYFICNNK